MEKLVLGEQFGDSFMCFNTSFSWNTYEAFDELADYLKGKTWFQKFDLLLGFTVAINVRTWNGDGSIGGGTPSSLTVQHIGPHPTHCPPSRRQPARPPARRVALSDRGAHLGRQDWHVG